MKDNIFLDHHEYGLRTIDAFPSAKKLPGLSFAIGISLFFLIFEIWNVIAVSDDLEVLMDNLVSTVGVVSGLFKLMTLRLKRRKLKCVLDTIIHDCKVELKEQLPTTVMENCARSQKVSKSIIILYNAMNFTYFLRTMLSYLFDDVKNRKFLAQVTFPFDARRSPIYEIVVISQFVTATICFNTQALIEGLLATLVLHACSKADTVRLEILKFSKICQSNDQKRILLALRRLSFRHTQFFDFFENIQDIISYVSFFHIFFLTLIQVFSGFMFLDALEKKAKLVNLIHYATLTTSFLVSSCYYCVFGEYLTMQGEKIFNDLYICSWYKFSTSEKKSINFMLMKARKPVHLTVGKFSYLSLSYFTKILKTSFSYLSLVRAVR